MYSWIKKILFALPPELAHDVSMRFLNIMHACKVTKIFPQILAPIKVMDLLFKNPIGLAAGLDKNGDYIDALAALGFGFIEVGTVTPKPQSGNPKPRLFRFPQEEAIVNRMGFNNKGIDHLVTQVKKAKFRGILGINIGKNRDTPIEKAVDDYVFCFRRAAAVASYITLNISSPNTPSLRQLQHNELLTNLLKTLKHEQAQQKKYVPLVVKISPDMTSEEINNLAQLLLAEKIEGVIATNTTIHHSFEQGGLSGKPLMARSTEVVKELYSVLKNQIPIIACGGVFTQEDVQAKFSAGASLVQIYSGLIYRGPEVIATILR